MRVHEAIVATLKDVGVDVMFGGAGENAAGMQIAVDKAEGVRGIIPKHEQNAAFMACGYAMFSGKLGVCFSTAGPGAFNLMSGLCVALTDSYPLIAITGYSTIEYDGRGQANETSGIKRTPNSKMILDAVVKKDPATGEPANYLVTRVEDVVPTMHKAIEIALTGRPGPVHVAIEESITYPQQQGRELQPDQDRPQPRRPRSGRDRKRRGLARRGDRGRQAAGAVVRLRRDPRRCRRRGPRLHGALPGAARHDDGRQGHRRRGPSAGDRPVLRFRAQVRLGGVPRFRRRHRARQRLFAARHVRFPRGPVRESSARHDQCRSGRYRPVLHFGPARRRRRQARHGGAARGARWPSRDGHAEIVQRARISTAAGSSTSPPRSIRGG